MSQNPRHGGMSRVLWALVLCLVCGMGRAWAQALPSAAKPTAGKHSKQPATPAPQPAAPAATTPAETAPAPAAAATPPPPAPVDPLGRTSPHGCVLGFLRAAEAKNYAKAAQYLDGQRSEKEGEELATQLKSVLDLGLSTSINDLSRSPTGSG
ncbi:MAG TPA: hypothetical protein VF214_08520, partial [Edaphobacter sp.]